MLRHFTRIVFATDELKVSLRQGQMTNHQGGQASWPHSHPSFDLTNHCLYCLDIMSGTANVVIPGILYEYIVVSALCRKKINYYYYYYVNVDYHGHKD